MNAGSRARAALNCSKGADLGGRATIGIRLGCRRRRCTNEQERTSDTVRIVAAFGMGVRCYAMALAPYLRRVCPIRRAPVARTHDAFPEPLGDFRTRLNGRPRETRLDETV